MKRTDALFRIVKSLTKAEKGYFKKFASKHVIGDKNNYVKLFDAVDDLKDYDERKLKELLKGESFLNHLAEAKYYLQKLILKSLHAFHSGSSIDSHLKELLHCIEILFDKGLFEDCKHLLEKGKRIASEYEKSLQLIELIKWERRLMVDQKNPDKFEKYVDQFLPSIEQQIDDEFTALSCGVLRDRLSLFEIKHGKLREGKEADALAKLVETKTKEIEGKRLTYESKRIIYTAYYIYHNLAGDMKKAYEYSQKVIALIESKPHRIKEMPNVYVSALHNHMICLIELGEYDEFWKFAERIRSIPDQYPLARRENTQLQIFIVYHLELDAYYKSGRFAEGVASAKNIDEKIERFDDKIPPTFEIILYFNLAGIYFGNGDMNSALKWVNRILNSPRLQATREDTQCLARIMNLIIHFELGNRDLLEYFTKSTFRYLLKKNKLYRFESVFLDAIKKLPKIKTKQQLMDWFIELKPQLEELEKDPFEKTALDQLGMIVWLESKITGKPFAEVMRERAAGEKVN